MALRAWPGAEEGEHAAYASVDATLAAVRAGEVDAAMVPIENSVEGGVTATLDALASGSPLVVIGERLVKIRFVLAAREGMALADIATVGTHSHAWAQVRGWMGTHLPEATYLPTLSTASAATDLAPGGEGRHDAAVCAPVAAAKAGLIVLAASRRPRGRTRRPWCSISARTRPVDSCGCWTSSARAEST